MIAQPTLIVIAATSLGQPERNSVMHARDWHHLQSLVSLGFCAGLPTVCLLPLYRGPLPIELPASCMVMNPPHDPTDVHASGIVQAVQATAHSPGWLMLPSQGALPTVGTVKAVAEALKLHPMAAPSLGGSLGHPLGFGPEFYSELIRLKHLRDLDRLMTRYPHAAVLAEPPIAPAPSRSTFS